jgi:L-ascorbate metabolism protein UlaG (beta-lactamase superfamily)
MDRLSSFVTMKDRVDPRRSWRNIADWAKHRPPILQLADRLGRGRGSLRVLDKLTPAPLSAPRRPDLGQWEQREVAALWVGHATVLLRLGGKTILTDPVFSHRIGLAAGLFTLGPARKIAPALPIARLPKIDLILISHAHFDHLDRPSLASLDRRIPIIAAPNTSDLIGDLGFKNLKELSWEQSTDLGSLHIRAVKVNHWGARTFLDRHRGFNGYLLESDGRRIFYAGDTAYYEGFESLAQLDLMIVGIGAYDPYIAAHANPEQAWTMTRHAGAHHVLPIHHGTFRLSHEPMHEPIERFVAAAGDEAGRIVIRRTGGQWNL